MDTDLKKEITHGHQGLEHGKGPEVARIDVEVDGAREVDVVEKDGEVDVSIEDGEGHTTTIVVHTDTRGEHGHGEHGHGGQPCVTDILVNDNPVKIDGREASGLQIKEAAIASGVAIQLNFVLAEERPDGTSKIIGDTDIVKLHDCMEFSAIRDDDNS